MLTISLRRAHDSNLRWLTRPPLRHLQAADPCGADEQNETTRTRGAIGRPPTDVELTSHTLPPLRAAELGLVVLITSSILLAAASYFSLVDPKRSRGSLMRALDEQ